MFFFILVCFFFFLVQSTTKITSIDLRYDEVVVGQSKNPVEAGKELQCLLHHGRLAQVPVNSFAMGEPKYAISDEHLCEYVHG